MKRIIIIITVLTFSFSIMAQVEKEKEAIKKVIQSAYIDGLQNKGDLEKTREGFHPGFNLLIYKDNTIDKLPIYNWIQYAEMRKEKNPEPPSEEEFVTIDFDFIDITGNAAVAKLDMFKGGKHVYTDYLSLYKLNDGWKIVSKIYHKIPEEK